MSDSVVLGDNIQLAGVAGDVTISTARPPYRIEQFPGTVQALSVEQARSRPGQLLLARHQVVPFMGRDNDLQTLADWMGTTDPLAVRLVYATGGQGKTRLAAHVANECAAVGWAVWQVLHEPALPGEYRIGMPAGGGLLAVVDYADRWPVSHLRDLITHLTNVMRRIGLTIRVLLLARSARSWWPALHHRLNSAYRIDATAHELRPLGDQVDRYELYRHARECFADAMQIEGTDRLPQPPGLSSHALTVHMASLVSVDAYRRGLTSPTEPHALSAYLLRREYDHWHALHTRVEEPRNTSPEVMGRVVYVATLSGALPRSAARTALGHVGLVEPGADIVIDDHRYAYPPDDPHTVLQPLYPDRLGEDLIALSTPGHTGTGGDWPSDDWALTAAGLLLTSVDRQTPRWAAHVVIVLVETARRWPHVGTEVLYPLLRHHPDLALAAGGTALARLAEIPDLDPGVLDALDAALPTRRHVDLDLAAAAIATRRTNDRLRHCDDPVECARLYANLTRRLGYAGLLKESVVAAKQEVEIARGLADTDPAGFTGMLAAAMDGLGVALNRAGHADEALAAGKEAVELYRRLVKVDSTKFEAGLANALANIAPRFKQADAALAASAEAVEIRRRIAASHPDQIDAELGLYVNNLGWALWDLNKQDAAVSAVTEGVDILRRLNEIDAPRWSPDYARQLAGLGDLLSNTGQRERAVDAYDEALDLRRRLAAVNPAAFEPDLAETLNGLGWQLGQLGRYEPARALIDEAVEIYQRLVLTDPAAHDPELGNALDSFAWVRVRQRAELPRALAAAQDAVAIYERLSRRDPSEYLGDLRTVLATLAEVCDALGRSDQAAAARGQIDDLAPDR